MEPLEMMVMVEMEELSKSLDTRQPDQKSQAYSRFLRGKGCEVPDQRWYILGPGNWRS